MSPLGLRQLFPLHFYSNFSAHVVLGLENRANSRESRASVESVDFATMENNYGIGVSNKFALFLDEEGEEADVENLLIINAKKVRLIPAKILTLIIFVQVHLHDLNTNDDPITLCQTLAADQLDQTLPSDFTFFNMSAQLSHESGYLSETLPKPGRGGKGPEGRGGQDCCRAGPGEEGVYLEGAQRLDLWQQGERPPRRQGWTEEQRG